MESGRARLVSVYKGSIVSFNTREVILSLEYDKRPNIKMSFPRKIFPAEIQEGDNFEYSILRKHEKIWANVKKLENKVL